VALAVFVDVSVIAGQGCLYAGTGPTAATCGPTAATFWLTSWWDRRRLREAAAVGALCVPARHCAV